MVLQVLRQEDHESKASLGYLWSLALTKAFLNKLGSTDETQDLFNIQVMISISKTIKETYDTRAGI